MRWVYKGIILCFMLGLGLLLPQVSAHADVPGRHLVTLGPGQRLEVTNVTGTNISIGCNCKYEFIKYDASQNPDLWWTGEQHGGDFEYGGPISTGELGDVIIVDGNTDLGSNVQFSVSNEAMIRIINEPVTRSINVYKGETIRYSTLRYVNIQINDMTDYSFAFYENSGASFRFNKVPSEPPSYFSYASSGGYVTLTNQDNAPIKFTVPYRGFHYQLTTDLAISEKRLEPGESFRITNENSSYLLFRSKVSPSGFKYRVQVNSFVDNESVDYVREDLVESDRENENINALAPGYSQTITNLGDEDLVFYGPADVFQPYSVLTGEDSSWKELKPGVNYHGVDTASGTFSYGQNLLSLGSAVGFSFNLSYNSHNMTASSLGSGWNHDFNVSLDAKSSVVWPDQHASSFKQQGQDALTSKNLFSRHDRLAQAEDKSAVLQRPDQSALHFDQQGKLSQSLNRYGNALQYEYNNDGLLSHISEPVSGKWFNLTYSSGTNQLSTVSDNAGRTIQLHYNNRSLLSEIVDAQGHSTNFLYDGQDKLIQAVDANGVTLFTNTYDSKGRVIKQADAYGRETLFDYDETTIQGTVQTTVTKRDGAQIKYVYDSRYDLLKYTDELGNSSAYTYDNDGNVTQQKDPAGNYSFFTYDSKGNMLTSTDTANETTTLTYDSRNNVISTKNAKNQLTQYQYDENNNVLSVTDAENHKTEYTYDPTSHLLLTEKNALGAITTYTYNQGLLQKVTDADSHETSLTYDTVGRISAQTNSEGATTSYTYDNNNNLLSATSPLGYVSSFTYDPHNQVLTATNPRGYTTTYTYTHTGQVQSVTDARQQASTYAYDAEDRVIQTTDPLNHIEQYAYDAKGRLLTATDAKGYAWKYTYDALDNVVQLEDPEHHITQLTYDSRKNVMTTTDPLEHTTINHYGLLGLLETTTDPLGNVKRFSYDGLNRLNKVKDADMAEVSIAQDAVGNMVSLKDPNDNEKTYAYDILNRMTSKTNASGQSMTFQYNSLGALTVTSDFAGQTRTFTYDEQGRLSAAQDAEREFSYSYDSNNNVTQITETRSQAGDSRSTIRTYDELDRLTSSTDVYGNLVQYTYDEAGNLISIVYPGNKIVSYTYDEANQLVQVEDWQQHQTHYEYDSQGLLVKITRPDGSVETRSYDAVGQLTGLQDLAADGTVIQRNTLSYDANGNLSEQQSDIEQQMFPVAQDTMTYGADNRLATFNGNETSFDANGNLLHGPLQGSIQAFEYDARNQLIAAGGFSYDYDAEGNRISRRYAGVETRFVVDSLLSNVIMETNSSNQPQTYYVYGLELISQLGADGSYKLYHFNSNGNTMALSNIEGAVTDRYAYDSFGELTLRQGDTTNPFLFDGRDGIMTDDNGLLYMRARYYNPEIKRFMNEDTYQGEIQDPLTLNQYSYVENNPLIKVDPSGHCGFSSRDQKTDCIIDFIPVVGSAKAASEVITGRNPITKEELSPGDRAISAVGLLPEGKVIAKGAKLLGKSVSKGFKAVKKLLGACNCFAAGTKVLTDVGEKNIEDIQVGDKVLSKDEETGEQAYKEVVALHRNEKDTTYKLSVGDQIIETTDNHPFWVDGKGWVLSVNLKVGDELVQSNGNHLKIDNIEIVHHDEKVKVYNFTVADFHTYFVSSLGIWVHNITCLPETSFTTKKLQHEWSHAEDFGIKGNWNKANGQLYEKAITNELKSATNVWQSTYRGDSVFVYYNKNTGIGMYTDLNGNYVGGWKFSQAQLEFHQKNGAVLFSN